MGCRKKGVGRGLHQSDIICSTVGWIEEASQTLEYGKNYDGYLLLDRGAFRQTGMILYLSVYSATDYWSVARENPSRF
jgi:hypothetical protein